MTEQHETAPPAPWVASASAVVTMGLTRVATARRVVPPPLAVLPVLPRLTVGGLAFVDYLASPVGPYRELLVFAGLVRCADGVGFFASHVYVDSAPSIRGGRAIWGLPKEPATLERREVDGSILLAARQEQPLARAEVTKVGPTIPVAGFLPVLSLLQGRVLTWRALGSARMSLARGRVVADPSGPLRSLAPALHLPTLLLSAPLLLVERPVALGSPIGTA